MKQFGRYLYFPASLGVLLLGLWGGIALYRHCLYFPSAAWIEIDYENSRAQMISFSARNGSRWRFEIYPVDAAVARSYRGDSMSAWSSSGKLDKSQSKRLIDMIYNPLWASINISNNYSIASEKDDYIVATSRYCEVFALNKDSGLVAQYGVYPNYSSVFYLNFSSNQVMQIIDADLSRAVLLNLVQYFRFAKRGMRPGESINLHGVVLAYKESIDSDSASAIVYDFLTTNAWISSSGASGREGHPLEVPVPPEADFQQTQKVPLVR